MLLCEYLSIVVTLRDSDGEICKIRQSKPPQREPEGMVPSRVAGYLG